MPGAEIIGYCLMVVAIVLFLLEIKTPGLGALAAVGAVALLAGIFLVFGFTWATLPVIVGLGVPLIAFVSFLAVLAHRARSNKVVTGKAGMIGLEGKAETDLLPEGKVVVRGELWDAVSPVRLPRGQQVRVTGVRGLKLEVSDASSSAPIAQRSVIGDERVDGS